MLPPHAVIPDAAHDHAAVDVGQVVLQDDRAGVGGQQLQDGPLTLGLVQPGHDHDRQGA
ncbi:MAG TPA: hypothetical protein VMA73_27645 [Streptosporangiaceae bacterium]|nr:hypothetical protein [Streptosporangiaceae bacterium]